MRKGASRDVDQGRDAYRRRAWGEAYRRFSLADEGTPLSADDLERLAWAAALSGQNEAMIRVLDRLYQLQIEAGATLSAARTAFWLCMRLFSLGEAGQASGWLARAQRLVEREGRECAEQGYLLLPVIQRSLASGNFETAHAAAASAAAIGDRFGEADLVAFGRSFQGRALLRQGRIEEGLALLDEAMIAATAGELSPVVTGLVYCAVIASCHEVYALGRAREWTAALSAWCDAQPELVTFTGSCLVHRAEILQLNGAWGEAIAEARRVADRFGQALDREAVADAYYQEADIHRLRGAVDAAEEAYRDASKAGLEPQPGLALLRVGQGRTDAAAAAMRRVVGATTDRLQRARLLPAHVEIMLAAGDIEEARSASRELEEIAAALDMEILNAVAAHATGAVRLGDGDARGALAPLRQAFAVWQQVGAPYIAARIRVLIGLACRALGDDDGAGLAFDASRSVFDGLGAKPDVARIDALRPGARKKGADGLTRREREVLGLVAAGKTNKAIARQLSLSAKTVDRHLSNILTKLDVPSRAAATAYAYEHKLI
jgi:DNA-binding CsgD family transcriptional regulator